MGLLVLGGGVAGANTPRIASGMGAGVIVMGVDPDRVRSLEGVMPANATTITSGPHAMAERDAGFAVATNADAGRLLNRPVAEAHGHEVATARPGSQHPTGRGPVESAAVLTEAEVIPKEAKVIPKEAEVISKEAEIISKEAEVIPKEAETIPKEPEIIPKEAETIPKEAEMAPMETNMAPAETRMAHHDHPGSQTFAVPTAVGPAHGPAGGVARADPANIDRSLPHTTGAEASAGRWASWGLSCSLSV